MQRLVPFVLVAIVFWVTACSNPADNSPRAVVTDEAPAAPQTASGKAETFSITSENSKIEFTGSKVTGSEHGSFQKFQGTIEVVDGNAEKSRVNIEIDTNSVTTDAGGLADHLRTADFFDVAKFPKATFTSTKIAPNAAKAGTYDVTGTLDLHGVKKTVSFPASIKIELATVTVDSDFSINRRDFGITYAGKTNDLIRDEVVLKLTIRATK